MQTISNDPKVKVTFNSLVLTDQLSRQLIIPVCWLESSVEPRKNDHPVSFSNQPRLDSKQAAFRKFWHLILWVLAFGFYGQVLAQQDGSLDLTFNADMINFGDGPDNSVSTITIQPDGRILIGGGFTSYNGFSRPGIARLNADGSLDPTFNPGSGINNAMTNDAISSIAIQSDGKILIAGMFSTYNGIQIKNFARLNEDGTLDATFYTGKGVNGSVQFLALQSDGKMVIGGFFTSYDGKSRNNIARINPDGMLDTSFDPGTGADTDFGESVINTLAIHGDGKIIIGGVFHSFNGTVKSNLARLYPDGSMDHSLQLGSQFPIYCLAIQEDEKILIGASWIGGQVNNRLARLNADGSLDNSFNPGLGPSASVYDIAIQKDNKIVIGGAFDTFNGQERIGITRLNLDGSLDDSFSPSPQSAPWIYSLAVQSDGKILTGGWGNFVYPYLFRVSLNGSIDPSFNPETGPDQKVTCLAVQQDKKILIGGVFNKYDGITRNYIARLNIDGSLDTSFDPGENLESGFSKIAIQEDGKIILATGPISFNGISAYYLVRLNSDGSMDATFNLGTGANNTIHSIALQSDGKILIAGGFHYYNGVTANRIARINTDGSLDTTFNPGRGPNTTIEYITIQTDGKILIGGWFTSFNRIPRSRIARLNPDGSLDNTFDPGSGANATIQNVALQPDNKILIGGQFSAFNGVTTHKLARLNVDGSLDDTFNSRFDPAAGNVNEIYPFENKILIAGDFISYDGFEINKIARLNGDGSLDHSFDPGKGANKEIISMAMQDEGKLLIVGDFTGFNEISRVRIARLWNRDHIEEAECKTVARAKSDIILKLDAHGRARLTAAMADNGSTSDCGPLELDVSCSDFTCEDLGNQTVDLIAKDASGGISSVPFNVQIVDEIRPEISVPPGIFVWLMRSGDEFRMPDFRSRAVASDNCSLILTQHPRPGTIFKNTDFGVVELEAKDPSVNIARTRFPYIIFAFNWRIPGLLARESEEGSGDMLTVPWNTPFEKLTPEVLAPGMGNGREILPLLQWDAGTYDPLTPGLYQVGVHLENRGFDNMDVSLSLPVRVLEKPIPENILLTNYFLPENLQKGAVIGKLHTVDAVDREHVYSMADHPDIYLENRALIWKGGANPPLETTVTVTSTDRAGQTISRDLVLLREMHSSDDALVYPNPATTHIQIYVRLAESSEVGLSIYDVTGRRVYEENGHQETSFTRSLDLEAYSSGLYHVIIQINNRYVTKRLVKE